MIHIIRTREELNRQFREVHRLVYELHYKRKIRFAIFFVSLLLVLTLISWLLPDSNAFIVLKGVSFVLTTIIAVFAFGYFSWLLYKRSQEWSWCKGLVEKAMESNESYSLIVSENGLKVMCSLYTTEIHWNYFKYYHEDIETIYLFPPNSSMYSCWSFSVLEIGKDNLELIKAFATSKLEQLPSERRRVKGAIAV